MTTESASCGTVKTVHKQHSWSPYMLRNEAWINRRINNSMRRGNRVTYDDLEEIRACLELGFGFESPVLNPKLFSTLPALDMYLSSQLDDRSTQFPSDSDLESAATSSYLIIEPGEDSDTVKKKLKEWAQVVASSLRHLLPNKNR